mmetsp:Transcript_52988/g.67923  ORF Transcript_52988/g.67923 Transcript_52988/m.67923 type:complete len:750 (+) Transcript_52988:765-3014(+)
MLGHMTHCHMDSMNGSVSLSPMIWGTDEPLGATTPTLVDTPSRFACPEVNPPQVKSLFEDKQKEDEQTMEASSFQRFGSALLRYTQLSVLPTQKKSTETTSYGRNKLSPQLFPQLQETLINYTNNKWVKMGKGDPTVLPLFHGCSRNSAFCDNAVQVTRQDANDKAQCPATSKEPHPFHLKKSVGQHDSFEGTSIGSMIQEQPTDLWHLSDRLVGRAKSFIQEHSPPLADTSTHSRASPFLLYMPLTHTHIPHTPHKRFVDEALKALQLSDNYEGDETLLSHASFDNKTLHEFLAMKNSKSKSNHGKTNLNKAKLKFSDKLSNIGRVAYGAALREADDMCRQVIEALQQAGPTVSDNTLTIVMSDNGPWLTQEAMGGSPFPFRGGKFSTNEGGVRVFCVMHWPGVFGAHSHLHHSQPFYVSSLQQLSSSIYGDELGVTTSQLTSALDIVPTFVSLAHGKLPKDRVFDGHDLSPLLYDLGEYRLLHHNYFKQIQSSKNAMSIENKTRIQLEFRQENALLSRRVQHNGHSVMFQEGGGIGAMRIGHYKLGNIGKVKSNILSQLIVANVSDEYENFIVFDLLKDQQENNRLGKDDHFFLQKPPPLSSLLDVDRNGGESIKDSNLLDVLPEERVGGEGGGWGEGGGEDDEQYIAPFQKLSFNEFKVVALYVREYLWHSIATTFQSDASSRTIQKAESLPCGTLYHKTTMCQKCQCDHKTHSLQGRKERKKKPRDNKSFSKQHKNPTVLPGRPC